MKLGSFLALSFLFVGILHSQDFNTIDKDGSIQIVPSSPSQEKIVELLAIEIGNYHKEIEKRIPFFQKEKRITDGKYIQASLAREDIPPLAKKSTIINNRYILGLKGGEGGYSLDEVTFWSRHSLVGKGYDPITTIREFSNKVGDSPKMEGLKLKIKKLTEYGITENIYDLKNIKYPKERIKLVVSYRDRLIEIIRTMDRYINGKGKERESDVRDSILEIQFGGEFQEPFRN